jgi:hypothetical protein
MPPHGRNLSGVTDIQTMVRTEVAVNGLSFYLAQGQDLNGLKQRIEAAARTGAAFVELVVVGNRAVDVLITAGAQVVFSSEAVEHDPRDVGAEDEAYGGLLDI